MTEILNLDKFCNKSEVSLKGKTYTIGHVSVGQMIEGVADKIDQEKDAKKKISMTVDLLADLSDIPREELIKQPVQVLTIILLIAQGTDPDKAVEAVMKDGDKAESDSKKK